MSDKPDTAAEGNEKAHGHAVPDHPLKLPRTHEHRDSADRKKPDKKKRSTWITWVSLVVVVLLIGGCVYYEKHKKPKTPPAPPAVPVAVTPVRTGSIDVTLDALGTVTPVYTVSVTARVTGAITEID
jgi:membrane fusion protein, multidrug efflux system